MYLIKELSKIYDIKKYSDYEHTYECFYIEHNEIKIYVHGDVTRRVCERQIDTNYIDLYIKRIEFDKLFIDKITNLFIYTVKYNNLNIYGKLYDSIIVGNIELQIALNQSIIVKEISGAYNVYKNIDDLIKYLKSKHPECIKNNDIKIALKD